MRSSLCSTPSRKRAADPLLVAAPFGDESLAPLALEVAPLTHEHGRDVDLRADHSEMRSQGEPDPLRGRDLGRHGVERRMERLGALPRDLPEQVLLRGDVVVERRLLHAELLGQVGERGSLVAALGEQPGGDPGQLCAPRGHL